MLSASRASLAGLVFAVFVGCFDPTSVAGQSKPTAAEEDTFGNKLSAASEFIKAGRLDEAEELVNDVLARAPQNALGNTLAGIIADRKNDLAAAEKHFALVAKLEPKMPEARNNYGAILLRLKRTADAAREFEASLATDPERLSALVNLAQIRFNTGDLTSAGKLFERAKRISGDLEILRALVLISLQLNQPERAREQFREYFELAKQLSPADLEGFHKQTALGGELFAKGLIPEARTQLEFILSSFPKDADALILLAKTYLGQKDIILAGRLLESAIVKGVNDPRIYATLAEVYKSGGYFENAIPAMRLAVEKDPKNEFYRARYGLMLIDSRAPAAAIIRLKESLEEFPGSVRILLALGAAQQSDGKSAEARTSFERAVRMDPTSVAALAYLAGSQVEQAQYDEAAKTYERALEVDEANAILHYLLADTLLKIPNADQSKIQRHLERSVRIDGNLAQAHFALGKLYARGEKWDEALREFEKTVEHAPGLAEAYYQLGRILARLKRVDESKTAFEKHKKLSETQSAQKETHRQDMVRRLADVRF